MGGEPAAKRGKASDGAIQPALGHLLAAMPQEWRGTTYKNSHLLGRAKFAEQLVELIASKPSDKISAEDLVAVGNAEDYLRVSSNISSTLELAIAQSHGCGVEHVFSFASTTMPIISVLLTSTTPEVRVYHGSSPAPFTDSQLATLKLLGCNVTLCGGSPSASAEATVLALEGSVPEGVQVDGVVMENVLYIANPEKIRPADILVIRKRLSTPATTPMAEEMLQQLANVPVTANREEASPEEAAQFYAHLQELSGTAVNASANPVVFTAGLPAICSLYVSLMVRGGADVLMCSTAYGGSSQLTDLLESRAPLFRKHTFDIQGEAVMEQSIQKELDALAALPTEMPTTLLFIEVPTNPAMKVPDVSAITAMLDDYKTKTGRSTLLMVDGTFAPGSKVLAKIQEVAPHMPAFVFLSMSKSVSRGLTTAGTIIANHTEESQAILQTVRETAALMDTTARKDQLATLCGNHRGVEQRCDAAYAMAAAAAETLKAAVRKETGKDLVFFFVTPEQAAAGFTTSTFSFNLPSPPDATDGKKAALAQDYVDLLCAHPEFKPCVSFGQDNNLVYATVPATSTQGAIKEEDKAKQAIGGVQLVRLSFPPTCERETVLRILSDACSSLYR